jgi:hypothetical protein
MIGYRGWQKNLPVIYIVAWILLVTMVISAGQKAWASNSRSDKANLEFLHGTVSQNELTDNLERLGIKCIIHQSAGASAIGTLNIDKVRLGSSAYYGGVLAGDIVKDLHRLDANNFALSFERSRKLFQVNLRLLSGQTTDQGPLKANVNHQDLANSAEIKAAKAKLGTESTNFKGDVHKTNLASASQKLLIPGSISMQDKEPVKKLLLFDIELIIDITGSMAWIDGTGDLTKFQWCHKQVSNLAQLLEPYSKTMAITTFNTEHQTMEGCTAKKVEDIYATVEPKGGTDLVDPLVDRLNAALVKHKHTGRPVLIVVITDGLPNVPSDPRLVNQALIDFTRQMSDPDEVVVTVLQIGDTFEGRDFCIDLADNLVNEGAKYDIVDTKTFAELKQEGLVKAMVDAVTETPSHRHFSQSEKRLKRFVNSLPSSSQSTNNRELDLKKREMERQTLEQRILDQ